MDDNEILAEILRQHPELLESIGNQITPELNKELQKQATVAGQYRATEMPDSMQRLGYDKWGTILAPRSPLEYLNAGLRQATGGAAEQQLMQQQIANLLRQKQDAQGFAKAYMDASAPSSATQGVPTAPVEQPRDDFTLNIPSPGTTPEAAPAVPRRPRMPVVPGAPAAANPQQPDPSMQSIYGIKMPWE